MVQDDRIVFLPVDVDDLFTFRDRSEWLVRDLQRLQSLRRGVQLANAAIDQDQARHLLLLFLYTRIAARDHLAHGCEIVHAFYGTNDELAVVALLHRPVLPNHHRGYGFRALYVRYVEALDALGKVGQAKLVL